VKRKDLTKKVVKPLSTDRKRENMSKSPKTTESTKKFVPKGKFLTTSNINDKTNRGKKSSFQSIFLKRKRNRIIVSLKFNSANRKLSKKTNSITDIIAKIAGNNISIILS